MKINTFALISVAALSICFMPLAHANAEYEHSHAHSEQRYGHGVGSVTEIQTVLQNYGQVLNSSDVRGVVNLFSPEGVFMAPNSPTAVGIEQVEAAYKGVFSAISTNLVFKVGDIKMISRDWAIARSTSSGSIKINANGAQIPSAFQELFVLNKIRGQWKIARYSFSSTLPAVN
jgi:uncharacterized protein (TIGR02246 family)